VVRRGRGRGKQPLVDRKEKRVYCQLKVASDSSVGIATGYGLDGPGIESRWGREFPPPSRPVLGAHPASFTMGIGSFSLG
jgi:hypothetical protein